MPASYPFLTCTGTIATNGVSLGKAPAGFRYSLDLSVPGEARVAVSFVGPAPANTLVNPVRCGDTLSLSFMTEANLLYDIEYKNQLSDPMWSTVFTVSGTGGGMSVLVPAPSPQRFFRLRVRSN